MFLRFTTLMFLRFCQIRIVLYSEVRVYSVIMTCILPRVITSSLQISDISWVINERCDSENCVCNI